VKNGAAVVFYQNEKFAPTGGRAIFIKVPDTRRAMSAVSAAFYGEPSKKLVTIGVTGTEGKSTTVFLIFQLLLLFDKRAGFISTVDFSVDGSIHPNPEHATTPESPAINAKLAAMLENGCTYAVIEASSHGLSPLTARLLDIDFNVAVMTNVTHEHLEFHGTVEQYRNDKANLFRAAHDFCVVNGGDPNAGYFVEAAKAPVYSFSFDSKRNADVSIQKVTAREDGNDYTLKVHGDFDEILVKDNLPGAFNAKNTVAAAIVVSKLLGAPLGEVLSRAGELKPVRGRMTKVDEGQDFEVFVDYAHTPSSFEAILPPVRLMADAKKVKVIAVFGSAGERDTQKRVLQGEVAGNYCDVVILTDEDPRGEVPESILEEIAAGVRKTKCRSLFLIADRPTAVQKAIDIASPGDIVLLLGKGHENSIIYTRPPKTTIAYDEIECAKTALRNRSRL
jgi:UDP-N-acetylmuramoyl-L-alanyl-D-glutamate--2,6-diaminopimelate ligase